MMFDSLHARAVRSRLLRHFTAFTRILLAAGFIPAGLTKLLGRPFTNLPTTNPLGYFFDAFFQAGEFYAFVGLAQIVASLLLLVPRTATLGAVIYFPIILNITVVTWSMGFPGTNWLTLAMLLACSWLLLWDYDRLKAILPTRHVLTPTSAPRAYARQAARWAVAGLVSGGAAVLLHLANAHQRPLLIVGGLAALGAGFGLLLTWHVRRMPESSAEASVAVGSAEFLSPRGAGTPRAPR